MKCPRFKSVSIRSLILCVMSMTLAQSSCTKKNGDAAPKIAGGFDAKMSDATSDKSEKAYWDRLLYSTVLIEGITPGERKGLGDLEYGTGSLISERVIITAAHVIKNPQEVYVILSPKSGMTSEEIRAQVRKAERVVFHPKYRSGLKDGSPFDVGLIFLKESVTAPNFPVKIVASNWKPPKFMHRAYLAGYGPTSLASESSFTLDLQAIYVESNTYKNRSSTELEVKTSEGTGVMAGDSGGPFVYRDETDMPLLLGVNHRSYVLNEGRTGERLSGYARSIDLRRPEIRKWIECESGLDLATQKHVNPAPGKNCGKGFWEW